jgi:hypothetical protein
MDSAMTTDAKPKGRKPKPARTPLWEGGKPKENKPIVAQAEGVSDKKTPHRWQKGQSGNPEGRPLGARQRYSESMIATFARDFEKHGAKVVQQVREERPADYLKIAASFVPRQVEAEVDLNVTSHEMRVAERAKLIEQYEARMVDVTPKSLEDKG